MLLMFALQLTLDGTASWWPLHVSWSSMNTCALQIVAALLKKEGIDITCFANMVLKPFSSKCMIICLILIHNHYVLSTN